MKKRMSKSFGLYYDIVKPIHVSNLCHIELVVDKEDGKTYVMRTYPEDKREVFELLQTCESPYIPYVKDIFFNTDTIIIEEYIDGDTLDKQLATASINARQTKRYLLELLKAVDSLHHLGIIHRDIKPENILIDKNNHIRLIDYGISRIYRPQEQKDTQLLGTVGYAAPEQFGYSQSDFRTDIFAIGMTCHILNVVCKPRHTLKKVEKKCTKFDPAQRYQNISTILFEFKKCAVLKGLSVLLIISLIRSSFVIAKERQAFMQSDITYDNHEQRLFLTPEPAPCILLTQDTQKRGDVNMTEQSKPVSVQAELTAEGLSLSIIDFKNHTTRHLLTNQYPGPEDYENTSLTAEILFYDLDGDGQKEILAAISDRANIQLLNGQTAINQNYMAGWCLYYQENSGFMLADGQLMATGFFDPFQVDGAIVPHGIWLNQEWLSYRLENGTLKELQW